MRVNEEVFIMFQDQAKALVCAQERVPDWKRAVTYGEPKTLAEATKLVNEIWDQELFVAENDVARAIPILNRRGEPSGWFFFGWVKF